MALDTGGRWWTGTEFGDIELYLKALQPGGYAVDKVVQAKCACGSTTFRLSFDQTEELAQTTCTACGKEAFVADSGEHWSSASPRSLKCPKRHTDHEIGLGLCLREGVWVRWMSVGTRCVRCGILASPIDWKSDLDINDPLAASIG